MRILIYSSGHGDRVSLLDADDLQRLCVETQLTDSSRIDAALRAAGAGRLDDDAAWLDIEYLRASASPADPPSWEDSFDSMVGFAGAHGWLSADARQLQAHVVTKAQGE